VVQDGGVIDSVLADLGLRDQRPPDAPGDAPGDAPQLDSIGPKADAQTDGGGQGVTRRVFSGVTDAKGLAKVCGPFFNTQKPPLANLWFEGKNGKWGRYGTLEYHPSSKCFVFGLSSTPHSNYRLVLVY
jgi:hypothetical protein